MVLLQTHSNIYSFENRVLYQINYVENYLDYASLPRTIFCFTIASSSFIEDLKKFLMWDINISW